MSKNICLAFDSEAHYERLVDNPVLYRHFLAEAYRRHPELFPSAWADGFTSHDAYQSAKEHVVIRRVKLKASGAVFALRPSFIMPYMSARTDVVEKALYLLQFGVPFAALAYVFGRDEMFWYRLSLQFGRPALVGTTVKAKEKLPAHLAADEKMSWAAGEKLYIPTTVAAGCFLGATVVSAADADHLTAGYQEFAAEARQLDAAYRPTTVCTDGFQATRKAWRHLFPAVSLVLCFLHGVIKLRDRCRGELRAAVLERARRIYGAENKRSFAQRARRFGEWAVRHLTSPPLTEVVAKLRGRVAEYLTAYDHREAHRTSNMVDRLMNYQDRKLYAMRYFHHSTGSARLMVRAIALLWNFHPYGERLRRNDGARVSPFCDLNGFQYHQNWLHNFLIASSMGGLRL